MGGAAVVLPEAYLLRDQFTTPSAVVTDGDADGRGYRNVSGGTFTIASQRLRGGATAGQIVYQPSVEAIGFTRVGGRTFCAVINPEDAANDAGLYLAETAGSLNGYGIRLNGQRWQVVLPNGTTFEVLGDGNTNSAKAIPYLVGITLNEGYGAVYWTAALDAYTPTIFWPVTKYGTARILYVTTRGTFDTVHPTIAADAAYGVCAFMDARLIDVESWSGADGMALVSDRFEGATGALDAGWTTDSGTFQKSGSGSALLSAGGVLGGSGAQAWQDAGQRNGWLVCDMITGDSNANSWELIARRGEVVNTILYLYNSGDSIYLDSGVAGSYSTLNARPVPGGIAGGSTFPVVWGLYEDAYRVFFGDDLAPMGPLTDGHADQVGTKHGLAHWAAPVANRRWKNFAFYPFSVALPSIITEGAGPVQPAIGAELLNKTFTAANGTALMTHDAAWTVQSGTWTIQSNRAAASGGVDRVAVIEGAADGEIEVDLIIPGSYTTLLAGLVFRHENVQNYGFARILRTASQTVTHEIELWQVIGGSAAIVSKAYLGDFFAAGNTYTLRLQLDGDVVNVFIDDMPCLTAYVELVVGAGAGLYAEVSDDGVTFDGFVVRAAG